jgi:predicted RNA methylase
VDLLEPTLFSAPDGLGPVGDPLGRCYTPMPLAEAIVASLPDRTGPITIVEPSVGGGAFARALRRRYSDALVIGVDIDPAAEGLAACHASKVGDWPTIARYWDRLRPCYGPVDIIAGNPPFGRAVGLDVTIAHVHACLDVAEIVSLLLPLPYLCGSEFDVVWKRQRPFVVHRVRARPWPTRLREVAVFEWRRGSTTTQVVDLAGWP